ncbi:unnamed protein product, partial [marine sediment metagenome]
AIASCASIAHSEHVAKQFGEAGYKAKAVHSKLSQPEIEKALTGLKDGTLEILTQCGLLGEGIDIPGATALIGLRPTMSETIFLQHIGRVLRIDSNKENAIILDHVGNYTRHGLPDDERFWSLNGSKKKDTDSVNYKRCPDCIRPVSKYIMKCPYCGHEWQKALTEPNIPEQKDGELIEITGERETQITINWETLKETIIREAKSLKQAITIAKHYGKTHRHAWWIWNHR